MASSAISSTVLGVLPVAAPTPALSNVTRHRSAASASIDREYAGEYELVSATRSSLHQAATAESFRCSTFPFTAPAAVVPVRRLIPRSQVRSLPGPPERRDRAALGRRPLLCPLAVDSL